ncbi:MAG TPA: choice-of-anchor tandem repeat GloVer-containing protein [Rhizomicrobium sp.]|nr:choice-of-anchor tandem repeat GloVer-containing protein [Rhizomicrobium sp.]
MKYGAWIALGAALSLGGFAVRDGAEAAKLKNLHDFCTTFSCPDGEFPASRLARDAQGNYYGTTENGGIQDSGSVFALERHGAKYKFKVLYDFCSKTDCRDGQFPKGDLVLGAGGELYGTTEGAGPHGGGTAFKLVPNASGRKWKLVTLYGFCVEAQCADGQSLNAGLSYRGLAEGAPYDGTSPLYGTTAYGGKNNGGTVYELSFAGGETTHTILHDFCSETNCADGREPLAPVLVDAQGNLFGSVNYGGGFDENGGVVFEMTPDGDGFAFTALHRFCQLADCADGKSVNNVAFSGNALIGSTVFGGSSNDGTVFKIVPRGANSKETVLYDDFCPLDNCFDGALVGPVVIDGNGDIYGSTSEGGAHSAFAGTIFKLHGKNKTVIYDFCAKEDCTDGPGLAAAPALDPDGRIFGVTRYGGVSSGGSAFVLTP